MASSPKHHHDHPSSSKSLGNSITANDVIDAENPKSDLIPSTQDIFLSNSSHLTRPEVLRRRSHNLKQLARCYRDHYWALMEELRIQHSEYRRKYGVSPFKDDEEREIREIDADHDAVEGSGENDNVDNNCEQLGLGERNNHRCAFSGCMSKAMALTSFCHLHILSDSKQTLYKPCEYVVSSAQAGPIICGKPILRSIVPSFCTVHSEKAQKHVATVVNEDGSTVPSSSKGAPNFHVIVAEYVRHIQIKRRAAQRVNKNVVVEEEISS